MRWPGWFPAESVDSAYHIDYDRLKERGIRGLIYDVDNTLVPHGAMPDKRARALFSHLHELGIPAVFVSNNREERVKPFAEAVGAGYVHKAGKPGKKGYLKAMEMMGTDASSTLFVGDQIFTDIWGANRAGIYSVLCRPIHPKEEPQIIAKRVLEAPVRLLSALDRRLRPGAYPEESVLLAPDSSGRIPELYGEYDGASGSFTPVKKNQQPDPPAGGSDGN